MFESVKTPHKYGEKYPGPGNQRRFVLTTLHKDCGGQVVDTVLQTYKNVRLKLDGTRGCCLCDKQPIQNEETYKDWV